MFPNSIFEFQGYLNDLWVWNGNAWAWIGGTTVVNNTGVYGFIKESSSSFIPSARTSTATFDPITGFAYVFGGSGYDSKGNFGIQ